MAWETPEGSDKEERRAAFGPSDLRFPNPNIQQMTTTLVRK